MDAIDILVNGKTTLHLNINFDKRAHQLAHSRIKQTVVNAGFDWKDAEVSVNHWPERGRHLSKSKGYVSLGASG